MNKAQIQMKIEMLEAELNYLKGIKIKCQSCEHFAHAPMCSHWQAPVPAETQAIGCDEWIYDAIPF
jgi:hypothetical protein